MDNQLKAKRITKPHDETEKHRLESLGYKVASVSKKGHYIMRLVAPPTADVDTADAIKTRFVVERFPQSLEELVGRLRFLHHQRTLLPHSEPRLSLPAAQRTIVLEKTDRRCHLCGGEVTEDNFVADHVLSHKAGGQHDLANYLPAHRLCNGKRWFYSPEEFQWILTIGVWARKQIEDQKRQIGKDMLRAFWNRPKRKKKVSVAGTASI
jgi:5-methylcytosine-specific restriction endonuclease McrA